MTTTAHDTFCDCYACLTAMATTIQDLPKVALVDLDLFDDNSTEATDEEPAPQPCLRCGRPLHAAASRTAGYGPTCLRKIHAAERAAAELVKPDQLALAIELVEDGAVVPVTGHRFLTLASDNVTRYETDPYTQTCTCLAGQYGRRCKHIIAATLIAA